MEDVSDYELKIVMERENAFNYVIGNIDRSINLYAEGKGKYEAEYSILFKKLIPNKGFPLNFDGELLRSLSSFQRERSQNGHCNERVLEIAFIYNFPGRLKPTDSKNAEKLILLGSFNINVSNKELENVWDLVLKYLIDKYLK